MINKAGVSLLIALLMFAISVVGYSLGAFHKPELFAYDIQAKMLRSDKIPDRSIKVILVDEAALKSMNEIAGRWPWPRAIWSDLLEFLSMGGARAALFDILFLERQDKANDGTLRTATRDFRNAYHSMMISREQADEGGRDAAALSGALPADFVKRFALTGVSDTSKAKPGIENNSFALPIAGLSEVSKGVAVVEFAPDSDNVLRRTKPLREYRGDYFPVLGLAPFVDSKTPVDIGDGAIKLDGHTLPVDANGNFIINMYALDKVDTYSISGVFSSLQKIRNGDVDEVLVHPDEFKDSIVFIGTSAVGTADLKAIPMGAGAPGVLLHAFLASNYLQDDFMNPPDRRLTYLSLLVGVFLTSWVVLFSRRFLVRMLLPLAMLAGYVGFALLSFRSNTQVEMVPFVFALFSTGFLSFAYLTFTEGAEKRRVSQLFTQYVSKDVLDEVLNNYEEYAKSSAGQKVEITVLFSDIRGFTTMSETEAPEKIVEMLNVHFTVMADIILKHNGTIDKYIGDAIMAFWGAPVRTDNHAEQAVLAGQEMLEGLKEVNRILKERGFAHEIAIGVGINTGEATIGNIGSEIKKNYTVVGDTVNLSSRLESITKEQKVPLIFSEYTYEKIKGKIACRLIGKVTVKGRGQAVDIYTTGSDGGTD
ncbi:MAG: adenylate/guanylate cyclase domain-containing protein [Aquabacterium sp.]|uniref:adenylate/guanylate cyclase domain-containing protein n=1 Tax=Aquabacterium sp. TaxID=1872578 RepID=UPI002728A0B1|nr:adenylate/guanylate cyclase domain-containing protein [Aquabacterium sp.]MDO9005025.1 adenylate/guanylate cyclase domain-containing protein [Aquabacterium sp.]